MRASGRRWIVRVVLVLFAVATAVQAAPLTEKPRTEVPAEKIRKALDQPIDLDIADQPLTSILEQLRDQTKVNFVLDLQTIASLGIDPMSAPLASVKLTNVKVRTALRTALAQFNLAYAIVGDSVHITTEELVVYRQLRQRVSVDLNAVKLDAALKQLARETGVNLLVDAKSAREAQTAVSLQLDDVPLDTVVRLMAEMAGLKAARVGNVLVVTGKAHAAELRAEPDLIPPPRGTTGMDPLVMPGGGVGVFGGAAMIPAPVAPPVPIGVLPPAPDKPAEKPTPDEKK